MKNIFKKALIIVSAFLFFRANAQIWELGGGIGTTNYKGDIVKNFQPLDTRYSTTLIVKKNFNPSFLLKFTATYGAISGKDKYKNTLFNKERNYSLTSSIWEIGFLPEYNFLDYRKKSYRITQMWSPYFFGGLALWGYNSRLVVNGLVQNPEGLPTSSVQLSIPMGIGVKLALDHFWNIGFEVGARKTFTDALDLTSDINKFNNLQVGDRTKSDWYFISTFYITYTFWKVNCPECMKDLQ